MTNVSTSDLRGKVFWITGLPGAGKTTLAKALYHRLGSLGYHPVLMDGDRLRSALRAEDSESYTIAARLKLAHSYIRLCQLIAEQGHIVICATVSMFTEVRTWGRNNISGYCEIFLDTSSEVLASRNQKELYSKQCIDVTGMQFPTKPDWHFSLSQHEELAEVVNQILCLSDKD